MIVTEAPSLSKKQQFRLLFRCALLVLGVSVAFCLKVYTSTEPVVPEHGISVKSRSEDEDFSEELPVGDEWMLVFYVFAVAYMFLALAIVVDEFFVPALMVISSKDYLHLSDDVAGATLMAAGGSAPELFTSFIGTFEESAVGFGTVIGSAVFNVLFVIAMCAVFSNGKLKLTWWPLFRDCLYYIICIAVLYLFFGVYSKKEILWWEALILFGLYIGYCLLMVVHKSIYNAIMKCMHGEEWEYKKDYHVNMPFYFPSTFRAGVVRLLTSDKPMQETAGIKAVTELKGDLFLLFKRIDTNGDNEIDFDEIKVLLREIGHHEPSDEEVMTMIQHMKGSEHEFKSTAVVSFEEFSKWYILSERRLEDEMERAFAMFDINEDQKIDSNELTNLVQVLHGLQAVGRSSLSSSELASQIESTLKELDTDHDGTISRDEFFSWYRKSMFWNRARELQVEEEDSFEAFSLVFPTRETPFRGHAFFFMSLPIVILLVWTLPDVRRHDLLCGIQYRRWCFLTFFGSITWIGIFSYLMVRWTEVIGDTLEVPSAVMGLTFLAAGTSMPDLLSSVIVAKQGKGDMAISSSIGSNIFDITVGLPIPWLAYSLIKWDNGPVSVMVDAESLEFSVLILLVMIILVVILIIANKWVMTRNLAVMMFVLYGIFLAQDWVNNFYCDKSYFDGCK